MTENRRCALVAYISDPVGKFVEGLRQDLHPDLPEFEAHITVLPPRILLGPEGTAIELVEEVCARTAPFEVSFGEVETFNPITPTVFIRVDRGAYRMRELHDQMAIKVLGAREEWPYMPHLTIVKMSNEAHALDACKVAREQWSQYSGSRIAHIRELSFVREESPSCWVDVAGIPLGRALVNS
jgi:2'-5' RNA ligase